MMNSIGSLFTQKFPSIANLFLRIRNYTIAIGLKKIVLAILTFFSFAFLFNPMMGLFFCVAIYIHEYGHVWAMDRLKIPHNGFIFIPFLGGGASPKKNINHRRKNFTVSIMGPVWGFGFSAALIMLYLITKMKVFIAFAVINAQFNILNLMPIFFLDGGRMWRTLSFESTPIQIGIVLCIWNIGTSYSLDPSFVFAGAGVLLLSLFLLQEQYLAKIPKQFMPNGSFINSMIIYLSTACALYVVCYSGAQILEEKDVFNFLLKITSHKT